MIFPEEIVTNSFIPTLRLMLANELGRHGLTEREIADHLGVSQSAVSKYKLGKVKVDRRFFENPEISSVIVEVANGLASGTMSRFEAMASICTLIRKMENRGLICAIHEELMHDLSGVGCDVCIVGRGELVEEQEVLSSLRAAVKLIERAEGFHRLIPNVGSNIAMAKKNAKDVDDVAAIPGRIYEMRGSVKVPATPEFGASKHVSEVILAVMRVDEELRAGLNLRFDEELLETCEAMGFIPLEIEARYEGRKERIGEKISSSDNVPTLVYHRGDFGIEPITYLLGTTALEVARKASELAQRLG